VIHNSEIKFPLNLVQFCSQIDSIKNFNFILLVNLEILFEFCLSKLNFETP